MFVLYITMSVNQPPSEKTDYYNPIYYNKGAEDEVTFEDLAGKVDRVGGVIVNGSFQGGEFETRLQAQDLTSVVKRNEVKQYADVWNANTVCYFDFSDPNNMGTDVTNHGRDATVVGAIQYVTDPTRTHAIYFPFQTTSRVFSRTAPCLMLDAHAPAFQTASWSVSMWVNMDTIATGASQFYTLFASGKSAGPWNGVVLQVNNGSLLYKVYNAGSGSQLSAPFGVTNGVWAHVAISSSLSGVFIYVNGVETLTSTASNYCKDATQLDQFVVGASPENAFPPTVPNRHYDHWVGRMSDVSIYSVSLMQAEVARLYADDYGYALYMLAGQSNMCGQGPVVAGIDDDYSELGNRVWQFNTIDNVWANGAGTGTGTAVIPATNPLRHLQGTTLNTGLWRTFAIDLLAYGNIARRRKIMLVPCARSSTGFATTPQNWSNGGIMSNIAIAATNIAMGLNRMNSLNGFLWNQGESDVATRSLVYRQNMEDMLALFASSITGFSTATTPIILGEISQVTYETYANTTVTPNVNMLSRIRADMEAICAMNPSKRRLVITNDLIPKTSDNLHWDADALRVIGSRYCAALADIHGYTHSVSIEGEIKGQTIDSIQDSLNGKVSAHNPAFTGTVSGVTKTHVGLGNVDNTSDANKPISSAVTTAMNMKAPVVNPVFLGYSTFGHINVTSSSADVLAQFGVTRASITNNLQNNSEYEVDFVKNGNSWSIPTRLGFAWMMQTNGSAITLVNLMQLRHNGNLETVGLITGPTITALQASIAALESGKATAASVNALSNTVAATTNNLQTTNANVTTMQNTMNGYATSFTTGTLTHNLRRASVEVLSASKTYSTTDLIDTIVIRGNSVIVTLPYINNYAFNGVMVTVYVDGAHSGEIRVSGDQLRYGAGDLTNHDAYYFDKGRCVQLMAIANSTVAPGYARWTVLG